MDNISVWGLHSFLAHIALGVDPVPGLEQICLLGFNQYGTGTCCTHGSPFRSTYIQ